MFQYRGPGPPGLLSQLPHPRSHPRSDLRSGLRSDFRSDLRSPSHSPWRSNYQLSQPGGGQGWLGWRPGNNSSE